MFLAGSYTPYLNLFLLNITYFLIFFLIAFYLGSKKFFLKIIKKNISYKILIFLIIFNPAVISIIGNFELDKLKKNEVYNFNELYNNVNKLSSNFTDRDIIFIIAESLEDLITHYTNFHILILIY